MDSRIGLYPLNIGILELLALYPMLKSSAGIHWGWAWLKGSSYLSDHRFSLKKNWPGFSALKNYKLVCETKFKCLPSSVFQCLQWKSPWHNRMERGLVQSILCSFPPMSPLITETLSQAGLLLHDEKSGQKDGWGGKGLIWLTLPHCEDSITEGSQGRNTGRPGTWRQELM